MFSSIYLFPVPRAHADAFVRVQGDAAVIYREHGCVDDVTYAPADLAAKYGCAGFGDVLPLRSEEQLFVGVSTFRERSPHDEVMARVDADPRIARLYEQVTGLLEIGRVVRGEFERVA